MQTGNTARKKIRSVPKKKEKLKVLIVKSMFLRIISPAFLALPSISPGPLSLRCEAVRVIDAGLQGKGARRSGRRPAVWITGGRWMYM